MKNFRKFDTIESYNKSKKEYPQVTLVAEDNSVHYGEEIKPAKEYLIPFRINPDMRYFKNKQQFDWVFIRYDVKVYSKADPTVLVESYERTEQIPPVSGYLYSEWLLPAKADMLYDVKITYLDDSVSNNPDRLHNTIKIPDYGVVAESGPSVGQGGFNKAIKYTHDDFYIDIVGIDPELMEVPDSYLVMELYNYQTMLLNFNWRTGATEIDGKNIGRVYERVTGDELKADIIGGQTEPIFFRFTPVYDIVQMLHAIIIISDEYKYLIQFQDNKDPFIGTYNKNRIVSRQLLPDASIAVPEHYEYTAKIEDYVEAKLPVRLSVMTNSKLPIDWITFDIKLDRYSKANPGILIDSKADEYEFVNNGNGDYNILDLLLEEDHLYDMTVTYNTDSQSVDFAGNILDITNVQNIYPGTIIENFRSTGFKITGIDPVRYSVEVPPNPTYINLEEVSHLQINKGLVNGVIPDKENLIVRTANGYDGQIKKHKFSLSDNSFWINLANMNNVSPLSWNVELLLEHPDPNNPLIQFRDVDFGTMTDIKILEQQKDRILLYYITSNPKQQVIELLVEPYQKETTVPVDLCLTWNRLKPINDIMSFYITLDKYAKSNPTVLVASETSEYLFTTLISDQNTFKVITFNLDIDYLYNMTVIYKGDSISEFYGGRATQILLTSGSTLSATQVDVTDTGFKNIGIDPVTATGILHFINAEEVPTFKISVSGFTGTRTRILTVTSATQPQGTPYRTDEFDLSEIPFITQQNTNCYMELLLQTDPINPSYQFKELPVAGMIVGYEKEKIMLNWVRDDTTMHIDFDLVLEPYQQKIPDITFQVNKNYPNSFRDEIEYKLYTGNYGYGDEVLRETGLMGYIDSATFSNEQGELPVFIELNIKNASYEFNYTPEMPSGEIMESNKFIFYIPSDWQFPKTIALDIIEVPIV